MALVKLNEAYAQLVNQLPSAIQDPMAISVCRATWHQYQGEFINLVEGSKAPPLSYFQWPHALRALIHYCIEKIPQRFGRPAQTLALLLV